MSKNKTAKTGLVLADFEDLKRFAEFITQAEYFWFEYSTPISSASIKLMREQVLNKLKEAEEGERHTFPERKAMSNARVNFYKAFLQSLDGR